MKLHCPGSSPDDSGGSSESFSHKTRLSKCRTLWTSIFRHAPLCDVHILQDTKSTILTALFVEDSVDALIDTLNTQALFEDQVKDPREYAHTNNFGCNSRTNLQRNRNSTDCHPSVPDYAVDHHATSTFAIVF